MLTVGMICTKEGKGTRKVLFALIPVGVLAAIPAAAAELVVPINLVSDQGIGKSIGRVTISEGKQGPVFTPQLTGPAPGVH